MKAFFKMIFGMFLGNDGILSSTKLLAFVGYSLFVFISIWTAVYNPEKFNYELFAILSAASSSTMRVVDKWLNVRSYAGAAAAIVETDAEVKSE
ncbi:MAG: hypothetical protein EOM80_17425 [Erysipelotrichia bacterium]|nr:hypothetical protein [Erysipelotrichia bacterium]